MHWLVLAAIGLYVLWGVALLWRDVFLFWGATEEERRMVLPGEVLRGGPRMVSTHAVTIRAPPEEVWPWLVQLGVGRGGFYSYSWLENAVGCGVRNADRIIPGLQELKEGDAIVLHPKAPPLKVTLLRKNRSLALEGWMFELIPSADGGTRLISRTEAFPPSGSRWADRLFGSVGYDLAHFIMSRKQLLEIKRLAESRRVEGRTAAPAGGTGA